MRLGLSFRSTAGRGRSTIALLLAGTVGAVIGVRWIDVTAWDDNRTWKDAA